MEHMRNNKVHELTAGREIRVPSTQKDKRWKKGAVVDGMEVGAEGLTGGKWSEFLKQTTFDPELGYPLEDEGTEGQPARWTGTSFDALKNPLTFRDEESLQHLGRRGRSGGFGSGGVGGADDLFTGTQVDDTNEAS